MVYEEVTVHASQCCLSAILSASCVHAHTRMRMRTVHGARRSTPHPARILPPPLGAGPDTAEGSTQRKAHTQDSNSVNGSSVENPCIVAVTSPQNLNPKPAQAQTLLVSSPHLGHDIVPITGPALVAVRCARCGRGLHAAEKTTLLQ